MPITAFRKAIRAAVRGLWTGALTKSDFLSVMDSALNRHLQAAWKEGAKECGIKPSEYTPEEKAALALFIYNQMGFVPGFADAIESGSKKNGGKLGPLMQRGGLWVNRYKQASNQATGMACKNKKLKWVYGDTLHCRDCLKLNGRVYRASVWQSMGISPQSSKLACKGYRCQCRWVETDEPLTRGRPPKF